MHVWGRKPPNLPALPKIVRKWAREAKQQHGVHEHGPAQQNCGPRWHGKRAGKTQPARSPNLSLPLGRSVPFLVSQERGEKVEGRREGRKEKTQLLPFVWGCWKSASGGGRGPTPGRKHSRLREEVVVSPGL